jgi:hypothetical protein
MPDTVRQFEECVDQSTRIMPGGEHDVSAARFRGAEREALGDGGRPPLPVARRNDAEFDVTGVCDTVDDVRLDAGGMERRRQFSGSPATGCCGRHRVAGIEDNGDGARLGARETGSRGGAEGGSPEELPAVTTGGIHNRTRLSG